MSRLKYTKVSDQERSVILQMARADMTSYAISKAVGRANRSVNKVLDEAGVDRSRVGFRAKGMDLLVRRVPTRVMQNLEAAAQRRAMKADDLALRILVGVIHHGNISRTISGVTFDARTPDAEMPREILA
jgi:hypothetical protein